MTENTNEQLRKRRTWIIVLLVIVLAACLAGCAMLVRAVRYDISQMQRIETVIASAEAKLGLKYVLNEEGPDAYDCSSLMQACFADAGVELPRNSKDIGVIDVCRVEDIALLQRGDIVCWDTVNDQDLCDHLGVYLGEGRVLHASTGRKQVVVDDMEGYFTEHFSWGLRPIERLDYELPFRDFLYGLPIMQPEETEAVPAAE